MAVRKILIMQPTESLEDIDRAKQLGAFRACSRD